MGGKKKILGGGDGKEISLGGNPVSRKGSLAVSLRLLMIADADESRTLGQSRCPGGTNRGNAVIGGLGKYPPL